MATPRRLVPLTEVEAQPGYDWVTTRWLRRGVELRTIPYFKQGPGRNARVLIDLDDLDNMIEARRLRRPRSGRSSSWRSAAGQQSRRPLASGARTDPEGVLGALQATHPPSSARVFGRKNEYELTLPDGGGRLIVKWIAPHD